MEPEDLTDERGKYHTVEGNNKVLYFTFVINASSGTAQEGEK